MDVFDFQGILCCPSDLVSQSHQLFCDAQGFQIGLSHKSPLSYLALNVDCNHGNMVGLWTLQTTYREMKVDRYTAGSQTNQVPCLIATSASSFTFCPYESVFNEGWTDMPLIRKLTRCSVLFPSIACLIATSASSFTFLSLWEGIQRRLDWHTSHSQTNQAPRVVRIICRAEHLLISSGARRNSYSCDLILVWCIA